MASSTSKGVLSAEAMRTEIKPDIGVEDNSRKALVELLNVCLCDTSVLYIKTKNYHWNIIGPRFAQLHKFLEEQYEELDEMVDEMAERARQLGGKSLGTMEEYLRHTSLKEEPGKFPDAQTMLSNLLKDHEAIIRNLRDAADQADEKYHDMATNDFFLQAVEKHEKMAWMLRAHLDGGKGNI
jgi:starvation-inducible DNA-binding protein